MVFALFYEVCLVCKILTANYFLMTRKVWYLASLVITCMIKILCTHELSWILRSQLSFSQILFCRLM